MNYLQIDQNYARELTEFINHYVNQSTEIYGIPAQEQVTTISLDTLAKGSKLAHNHLKFIGVSDMYSLLNADVQKMMRQAHQELGFEYVKMHNIFDDRMMFYHLDEKKEPHYFYRYIDMALDFLVELGVKPMIQLSFMPVDLAKNKNRTIFQSNMIISEPWSMDLWNDLVSTFTRHLLNRYGKEEICTWFFLFLE